jgi:hypothetical protein
MFGLSAANLVGNLLFSSVGFVAFVYGKRSSLWGIMFCGLGLMIFPYFVGDTIAMYVIGAVGTITIFFLRH